MKKLIRNKGTQTFLTKEGGWTANVQEARVFSDDTEARAAVQQFNLQGVDLYYWFDEYRTSQWDFVISLDGARRGPQLRGNAPDDSNAP